VFFIAFVILGVSAVRLYWIAARPRRRLEVSGAGLTVGRGERWRELPWSELARVRVVTDRRKPWVVVWPRDPEAALSKWGKGFSAAHGGLRVFPVGHERRRGVRNRQVQELRAALSSYGGAVYDPSS
jgi:hypothetical protein